MEVTFVVAGWPDQSHFSRPKCSHRFKCSHCNTAASGQTTNSGFWPSLRVSFKQGTAYIGVSDGFGICRLPKSTCRLPKNALAVRLTAGLFVCGFAGLKTRPSRWELRERQWPAADINRAHGAKRKRRRRESERWGKDDVLRCAEGK